ELQRQRFGRPDYRYGHDLAADPVRAEAPVLKWSAFPSSQRRGGCAERSEGADGVVSSAGLTTITASRYLARASRPSAALQWLRNFLLLPQPPLLCEEGNITRP